MKQGVREFYEALAKDTQMQQRASKLNDNKPGDETEVLAAMVTFAAQEGYSFTVDEVKAYIMENIQGELSDNQLDAVAGGAACVCVIGGGSINCGCVFFGSGNNGRCFCALAGGA